MCFVFTYALLFYTTKLAAFITWGVSSLARSVMLQCRMGARDSISSTRTRFFRVLWGCQYLVVNDEYIMYLCNKGRFLNLISS